MQLSHKERFYRAITMQELDKMPHTEQMIHDALVAQIVKQPLPGDEDNALFKWMNTPLSPENFDRHVRARNFLGFDHVQVFPIEKVREIGTSARGNKLVRDIWGAVLELTAESTIEVQKPIEKIERMDEYAFPDVDDFAFDNVEMWVEEGSFFVAPQVDTGYFKANQFFGLESYMEYLYTEPERLHRFMDRFTDFQIGLCDRLIALGADGIILSDDHAFNAGPFLSPEKLQEFDFAYMKRIVDHVHQKGVPVVLHSCGNLNKTIELLVETGIDALHAIQPSAGNDIFAYKRKYGDRLCLIGNLDINYLLPGGSPEDVALKVAEMAERMFYDRKGFVLSTCNMLNIDVPVENAITMHLAAERY